MIEFEKMPSIFLEKVNTTVVEAKEDYALSLAVRQLQTIDDNVKIYSNGVVFLRGTTKDDNWDKRATVKVLEGKSPQLSLADIMSVNEKRLKVNFAIMIKPAWAAGVKIKDLIESNNGKSLFKTRNLEKYYSIFNKNHAIEKGIALKQPQNTAICGNSH